MSKDDLKILVGKVNEILEAAEPDNVRLINYPKKGYYGYKPFAVKQALNEVFTDWNITVLGVEFCPYAVRVAVNLLVGTVFQTKWENVHVDNLKFADDAFLRAAALFGIGAKAFEGKLQEEHEGSESVEEVTQGSAQASAWDRLQERIQKVRDLRPDLVKDLDSLVQSKYNGSLEKAAFLKPEAKEQCIRDIDKLLVLPVKTGKSVMDKCKKLISALDKSGKVKAKDFMKKEFGPKAFSELSSEDIETLTTYISNM